jgi:putative ABC transport system ATP-binding protein
MPSLDAIAKPKAPPPAKRPASATPTTTGTTGAGTAAAPDSDALVTFDHVYKTFTNADEELHALTNVHCSLRRSALNIITGPSGSGKSTMLDTIVGLQPPTSGTVTVAGQNIYTLATDERSFYRARMLGMVYQANYWVRSLNVIENVAMPLYLSGYDRKQAEQLAELSLESVEMLKYAKYLPTLLSGGQQQRVSMARALVANPEVIVADEPTGNLDTRNGSLIMDLLMACVKERSKTVILVTHNLEYLPLGDKNLFIKDGILTEGLSNEQIIANLSAGLAKEAATTEATK